MLLSMNIHAEVSNDDLLQSEFHKWCIASVNALSFIDIYANVIVDNSDEYEHSEQIKLLMTLMERKLEFQDDLISSCLDESSEAYAVLVEERNKTLKLLSDTNFYK